MKKIFLLSLMLISLSIISFAQVQITYTGSYFQSFDSLKFYQGVWKNNLTLPDWLAQRTAGQNIIGLSNGNTTTGNLYNFGTVGAADRALGNIGSGGTGDVAWGVILHNTSGTTINNLVVSYIGEEWRVGGSGFPQTVNFFYKILPAYDTVLSPNNNTSWTAVPALNFTGPNNSTPGAALDGNLASNRGLVQGTISGINIPDGYYVILKWDDINNTGSDNGNATDSLNISWIVPSTITTGAISGSPFCITSIAGANIPVPYTKSGVYNAGNMFKAYLSDASGSFASETEIGSLTSTTSGTITATIPAGTPTGAGYRIRVKSTNPAIISSNNGSNLIVVLNVADVTNASASAAYQKAVLNFTPPPGCYNELMVVAKPLHHIYSAPSGNGSSYTANSQNFTDPLNTTFDTTGKVVYKSAVPSSPLMITGLTNGTRYYFKFFTRQGTLWSPGVEVNVVPVFLPDIVITEIMYDDPSTGTAADSLEFIELYNNDTAIVDFTNWAISSAVNYTFPAAINLNPGNFIVIAKKAVAVDNFFSTSGTLQWSSGNLSNTGELVEILDQYGNVVDSLTYRTSAPWPTTPGGNGPSLTLCNPGLDNSIGSNWQASAEFTDSLNHMAVYATPGTGCAAVADVIPPIAISATATSLSTVLVKFNEPLEQTSAQTVSHYTWVASATGNANLYPAKDTVLLNLSTPLVSGVADTLYVTGVKDTANNTMALTYKFPVVFGSISSLSDIVYWNFPDTSNDQIADGGIAANLAKIIRREPSFAGTYGFTTGSPTNAIRTNTWQNGNNTKYWVVDFTTFLYDSLRLSSKQRSSSTGPRDFVVEYSLNGSSWTVLPGTNRTCNDSWTQANITNYLLPVACNSQPTLYLRWIMTSDSSVNDSVVLSAGASRIDEIYVKGRYNPILGTNCSELQNSLAFTVNPNPSDGNLNLLTNLKTEAEVAVRNLFGQQVFAKQISGYQTKLDLSFLPDGVYIISITDRLTGYIANKKIIIR